MNPPKWLRSEIDNLGRSVASEELDRAEVIDTLKDHVLQDDGLVDALVAEWVAAKLEDTLDRFAKARKAETERLADQLDSGWIQPGFEQIYSDYWPRSTYGPMSTLADLGKHAEDMLALSGRHKDRAQERYQRWQELLKAAGGDEKTTWYDAERARLGLEGPDAATAGQ